MGVEPRRAYGGVEPQSESSEISEEEEPNVPGCSQSNPTDHHLIGYLQTWRPKPSYFDPLQI